MRNPPGPAILAAALFAALPRGADAQAACEHYRVKPGDSLMQISRTVYGSEDYHRIYRANTAAIGGDPNLLEVGTVLRLPCLDNSLPERAPPPLFAEGGNDTTSFGLITANGYPPYTDESLPGRGLITRLVETAILRAAPGQAYEVLFVNDWPAHLEALLPSLAFDASFPWPQPECEGRENLTPLEAYSCENYLYSEPLYEIVDGFFALRGSGYDITRHMIELRGAIICRPEGYSAGHLASADLMPPVTELFQPDSINDCFDALLLGQVDLVFLDTRSGERAIKTLGIGDKIVENPNISFIVPLRVAVHSKNPEGVALLETLNRGLREMLESGEWNHIVSEGLLHQMEARVN